MQSFKKIYSVACKRKGGESAFAKELPKPKTKRALAKIGDDRFLSQMTKSIFQAGFVWRVIENKWDGFEKAFYEFDVAKNAKLTPGQIEKLAANTEIVRNKPKIVAVRHNARMIQTIQKDHGSFGKYVAHWPENDLIGLYENFKKDGARLGGMSSQYFLRYMGKDTFIITPDVTKALIAQKVVAKAPTSKSAMRAVQAAFNEWHAESGVSYSAISKTLACSVD